MPRLTDAEKQDIIRRPKEITTSAQGHNREPRVAGKPSRPIVDVAVGGKK